MADADAHHSTTAATSRASSVEVEGYVDKQEQLPQQQQQEGEQAQPPQQEQQQPQQEHQAQPQPYHLQFPTQPVHQPAQPAQNPPAAAPASAAPQPPLPGHFHPTADQVSAIAFHHNADASSGKSVRWSNRDDVLLCDALVAQHQMGRNRFNGIFHVDAWDDVAEVMKGSELVSGGAPKNLAHCKARWQRLKVEYRAVKLLRNEPGFSWDENTQMVVASPQTWEAYIAKHKDAQPWRKKKFPCYSRCAFLIEDEHGRDKGDVKFKQRWDANVVGGSGGSGSASSSSRRRRGTSPSKLTDTHDQDAIGEIDPALTSGATETSTSVSAPPAVPVSVGATTGVFPVIRSDHNGTKFVHRFSHGPAVETAPAVPPAAPPPQPLSPRTISSAIQQYQSQLNGNGKRPNPTEDEHSQESISKRANTNTAPTGYSRIAPAPPPPAPAPVTAYAPVPYPVAAPAPASAPAPAPPAGITSTSTTAPSSAPAPPPPPSSSPSFSRLTEAITSLESTYADDGLSELQFVKAIQLFQRRADALEAYLAIQSRRARLMYVKAELDDMGCASVAGAAGG